MKIDPDRAYRAGVRRIEGQRLTLWTDVAPQPAVEELSEVFAQAFAQWCQYFGVDPQVYSSWKCTGVLIGQADRIREAGLLPSELPPFDFGFSRGRELWIINPPSDYYRRHLLLHEGVHSFMNTILGNCGPTWYMEGIAEMLATHRWEKGELQTNYFPQAEGQLPLWGRIRMVRDDLAAGRFVSLEEILHLKPMDNQRLQLYGWCWAAAAFLDRHPDYQNSFRRLPQWVTNRAFNRLVQESLGEDWGKIEEQWAWFIYSLEFGYDVSRETLDLTPGKQLVVGQTQVSVFADRGWQNTNLRLRAGTTYRIQAQGRYQLGQHPVIWWCEPGGVSIRYYRGKPLGVLLACIRPDQDPRNSLANAFKNPLMIGLGSTIRPEREGTLYFRVNDSAGELHDNIGQLIVRIEEIPMSLTENQRLILVPP